MVSQDHELPSSNMQPPPRKVVNVDQIIENATLAEKISLLAGESPPKRKPIQLSPLY